VTVTSRGGDVNRYPSGRAVVFNRIAGHRDGDKTACPGDALYGQLPELRRRAAIRQRQYGGPQAPSGQARLTLATISTRVSAPAEAQVSGVLVAADGAPLAGRAVSLQVEGSTAWVTVARVTTGDDGSFAGTMPVNRNGRIRAHYGRGSKPVISTPLRMTVVPSLKARVARRIKAGSSVRVSIDVAPRRPRVVLALARQRPDGTFAPAGAVRARVKGRKATASIRLRKPGLYRIVAQAPADARAAAATAPWVFVRAIR